MEIIVTHIYQNETDEARKEKFLELLARYISEQESKGRVRAHILRDEQTACSPLN